MSFLKTVKSIQQGKLYIDLAYIYIGDEDLPSLPFDKLSSTIRYRHSIADFSKTSNSLRSSIKVGDNNEEQLKFIKSLSYKDIHFNISSEDSPSEDEDNCRNNDTILMQTTFKRTQSELWKFKNFIEKNAEAVERAESMNRFKSRMKDFSLESFYYG
jgi:hypothetical protein